MLLRCKHCGAREVPSKRATGVWRVTCRGCNAVRILGHPPEQEPLLTVLNYSGGKQSTCILWMVLRGEIQPPESFIVLTADPGMENAETYAHVRAMQKRCADAGLEAVTVEGPNLYQDLVQLRSTSKTRLDNPPYWTFDDEGKRGRLRQRCTSEYKIRPMDQYVRKILSERFGLSEGNKQLGAGIVDKWIGFSADELGRVSTPYQKYVRFSYPLIERGMDRAAVDAYFRDNGLPTPPRSVCNACFANGLDHLEKMYRERPEDWKQAVEVDEAVRDLSQIGVNDRVYVSATGFSLRELAERGFDISDKVEDADAYSCDSGYCFT